MSRFFSKRFDALEPYVPGEQPQEGGFVKLNTNESPFPPSPKAVEYAAEAAKGLQLYPDPECRRLAAKIAEMVGLDVANVFVANGSDEALNFAFGSFCDELRAAVYPDITYGFYPVFAAYNRVASRTIALRDDMTIDVDEFCGFDPQTTGAIVIANPNAPTGFALGLDEIERIVASNPDIVVIVDEAYVDFGATSAVSLIGRYENLLVTQTFSKSRAMAGARLGFAIGQKELIADLNTLKYSTNPYNVDSMTLAAGLGALEDEEYTRQCCTSIIETRSYLMEQLAALGFEMTDSLANFVFAKHPGIGGTELYEQLKARKVLVRHFSAPRIEEFNRITVGTRAQADALLDAIRDILKQG
ncbi:MAG: histidinol-phosphate transaminase [bacterium]|nr:histidinol-phosphate transaminase [bacterium]